MASYIELLGLFVLLMLPFLYETNHIFRYYFKFFIYYGIVSFNSVILIPAFLARPCDVRNLLWASTFCHRVSTLIGLRWELRGKEHLEKERACIIVANHQSSLDVLGMFDIWHVMNKCTVVAKRELFYAWPFGLAAWLAGLIFIDRVRGEKARATLNAVNSRIKKQKIKLWVFPEGTRRNTGEIHAFKKGAFHMAIDEQIPIMPVVFSSYCTFLNDKKKILNAGNIIVTTLPPISTTGLTKDNIDVLMEHVHRQMSEVFKITSAEVLMRYKPHKATSMMATTPNVPVSSSSSSSATIALTKNCGNNSNNSSSSSSSSGSASSSGSTSSTSISNSSCNNTVVVTTTASTTLKTTTAAAAATTTQYSDSDHYVDTAASPLTIATPVTMLKNNILTTVVRDIGVLDDSGGGDDNSNGSGSGDSDFDDNDGSDEDYKSSISGKAADIRKTLQAI